MINLITGLPRNGKTLYTIDLVKAMAEKDNRPVFYSGIPDVAIPSWTEIDAEKWFTAPKGAIIIIDECQRVFRPRSQGKEVPDYVAELETHGHQGHDLFLITQHPMLADTNIRRLAGRHMHVVRTFGTHSATVHEWPVARINCEQPVGRKDSIKHAYKYNKDIYALYKSADMHTVKRAIPMRLYMIFVLLGVMALLGYRLYGSFQEKAKSADPIGPAAAAKPGVYQASSSPAGEKANKVSYTNAVADAKQYVFDHQPRITGLPHTSPRYDEVTKPVTAPVPTGCVASKTRCTCFSQQATRMDVPEDTCRNIVANGFFVDFDDKGGRQDRDSKRYQEQRQPPVQVARESRDQVHPGDTRTYYLGIPSAPVQAAPDPGTPAAVPARIASAARPAPAPGGKS